MLHSDAFRLFVSSLFLFLVGLALVIFLAIVDFDKDDMGLPLALFLAVTMYIAPVVAMVAGVWLIWTY